MVGKFEYHCYKQYIIISERELVNENAAWRCIRGIRLSISTALVPVLFSCIFNIAYDLQYAIYWYSRLPLLVLITDSDKTIYCLLQCYFNIPAITK